MTNRREDTVENGGIPTLAEATDILADVMAALRVAARNDDPVVPAVSRKMEAMLARVQAYIANKAKAAGTSGV